MASRGVSLDERGSGQSGSMGYEPRHCATEDTLSEPDLAHVSKCVLGRQQALKAYFHLHALVLLLQIFHSLAWCLKWNRLHG